MDDELKQLVSIRIIDEPDDPEKDLQFVTVDLDSFFDRHVAEINGNPVPILGEGWEFTLSKSFLPYKLDDQQWSRQGILLRPTTGPPGANGFGDIRKVLLPGASPFVIHEWDELWDHARREVISHLDPETLEAIGSALPSTTTYNLAVAQPRFRQLCDTSPVMASLVSLTLQNDMASGKLAPQAGEITAMLGLNNKELLNALNARTRRPSYQAKQDLGKAAVLQWISAVQLNSEHGFEVQTNTLSELPGRLLQVARFLAKHSSADNVRSFQSEQQWRLLHRAILVEDVPLATRILRNPSAAERAFTQYFPDNIRSDHGEEAIDVFLGQLRDFLRHRYGNYPRTIGVAATPSFQRVAAASKSWHHDLRNGQRIDAGNLRGSVEFAPSPLDGTEIGNLKLQQLRNGDMLDDEGEAMGHCVSIATYSHGCDTGESQMFSVLQNGRRVATLRLGDEYEVAECFGPHDSAVPTVKEQITDHLARVAPTLEPYEGLNTRAFKEFAPSNEYSEREREVLLEVDLAMETTREGWAF